MARAVSLQSMREAARQRANMENSQFVTDVELNAYLNAGLTELYDLLVGARGQDYYFNSVTIPLVSNQTDYVITNYAPDFYDLLGIDLFVNGRFITLGRFEFAERNRFQNPTILSLGAPMVYNIIGNKIRFLPPPSGQYQVTLNYIPAPPTLVNNADTFDGVAGWEEYAISHAVMLMLTKQESDPSVAVMMKQSLKQRIEAMAAARNQAQPARISDQTIVDVVNLRILLGYP